MVSVIRTAARVQTILDRHRWRYCFIGGVESIIAKQHRKKLDWRYIHAQRAPLVELKKDPQIVPKLKHLRRIVESDEAG